MVATEGRRPVRAPWQAGLWEAAVGGSAWGKGQAGHAASLEAGLQEASRVLGCLDFIPSWLRV